MRRLALLLILLPAPALAHIGHLGELAGHTHWVGAAAIGAAAVVGAWGWLKGRKSEEKPEAEEAEPDAEAEEA